MSELSHRLFWEAISEGLEKDVGEFPAKEFSGCPPALQRDDVAKILLSVTVHEDWDKLDIFRVITIWQEKLWKNRDCDCNHCSSYDFEGDAMNRDAQNNIRAENLLELMDKMSSSS